MEEKPVCEICKRIRFVVFAVIIALIVGFRPEFDFLRGVDLTRIFAWVVVISVSILFLWKSYLEFWKK